MPQVITIHPKTPKNPKRPTRPPAKERELIAYWRHTFDQYGYRHTRLIIYKRPTVEPIHTLIENCDKPGWYQTEAVAAGQKRLFTAMREAGVESVIDTVYTTRVELSWQHAQEPNTFCTAHVKLRERPGDVESDYRFYQSLLPRFAKVDPHHRFEQPPVVLGTLERMGAREIQTYRKDRDWTDRVFYRPDVTPPSEPDNG